jgi:membrane protease YdiL (CAAX protease family)
MLIAPLWHTVLVIAALVAVSTLGLGARANSDAAAHHVRLYWHTLGWEWTLAAMVFWGLWLRRTPVSTLLGAWPPGAGAWLRDAAIGVVFWMAAALGLRLLVALLTLAHLRLPQGTVAAMAPSNASELLLFLVLCLSAGFCEELVFRGYLQQQAARIAHDRAWIGVVASALLFGIAHLYQGAAGVILIALFGAMFSLLARSRGSLRPGMLAHTWNDALVGITFFLLHRSHVL